MLLDVFPRIERAFEESLKQRADKKEAHAQYELEHLRAFRGLCPANCPELDRDHYGETARDRVVKAVCAVLMVICAIGLSLSFMSEMEHKLFLLSAGSASIVFCVAVICYITISVKTSARAERLIADLHTRSPARIADVLLEDCYRQITELRNTIFGDKDDRYRRNSGKLYGILNAINRLRKDEQRFMRAWRNRNAQLSRSFEERAAQLGRLYDRYMQDCILPTEEALDRLEHKLRASDTAIKCLARLEMAQDKPDLVKRRADAVAEFERFCDTCERIATLFSRITSNASVQLSQLATPLNALPQEERPLLIKRIQQNLEATKLVVQDLDL